jgi:hypothetical protein
MPQNFVFRMPATDFIQPNPSSMRFPMRWLTLWPECLVVRLSMAG